MAEALSDSAVALLGRVMTERFGAVAVKDVDGATVEELERHGLVIRFAVDYGRKLGVGPWSLRPTLRGDEVWKRHTHDGRPYR